MKKLNFDIKVGDHFQMEVWGWQCAIVPKGEYEIIDLETDEYAEYGVIKQVDGCRTFVIHIRNLQYMCGKNIKPKYSICYDCEIYQPSKKEFEEDKDFIIQEPNEEFGFWYLGTKGDESIIESSMLNSNFAWVKMPW